MLWWIKTKLGTWYMDSTKPWHFLHYAWQISLYVLDHEQIPYFVAHLCTSLLILISPSDFYYWWVDCILWQSILLLSESSLNGWLRYLHPYPVEIVCDVTDWCRGVLQLSQCFCHQLLFSLVNLSVAQYSLFLYISAYTRLLYKLSPMLVQWPSLPLFSKLENGLLFSQRQLSGLHSSYKHALSAARSSYFSALKEEHKNNPRYLFHTVSSQTKSICWPMHSCYYSRNDFMNFFDTKLIKIRETIQNLSSAPSMASPVPDGVDMSFRPAICLDYFTPIKLNEFCSSKNSTCLLDPLGTGFLKQMLPEIGTPLLNLINASLTSGYVPQSFKIAVIKPILKKPNLDPNYLSNYRPISNLPFQSKILEKAVTKQLCSFLQSNSTLEVFQSGFRPHHSTETALLKVLNDLLLSSDKGFISLLVLLDLSAASDTIDHLILIDWLKNLVGLSGQALSWFRSYLSERHQFVYTANESSYRSRVVTGAAAGAVATPPNLFPSTGFPHSPITPCSSCSSSPSAYKSPPDPELGAETYWPMECFLPAPEFSLVPPWISSTSSPRPELSCGYPGIPHAPVSSNRIC